MSEKLTAYRNTHAPEDSGTPIVPEYHRYLAAGSPNHRAELETLARTVHLPVAAVRGALSSYSDTTHRHGSVRVCAGTSCMLAGGGNIWRTLTANHSCEPVYCLGYCDRSPAAMTPGGNVVCSMGHADLGRLSDEHAAPHPPPPSIRCVSRHAIITKRLLESSPVESSCPHYAGLRAAQKRTPQQVLETVAESGVKGRGGAAYPTARKWLAAAKATGDVKFVVANGDEGDPGSFIDRELMERDPHAVLEGMAICAYAIGASRGIVFIRSEYPVAVRIMTSAIEQAREQGLIGPAIFGSPRGFEVDVVQGLGSYVCGEETALLNAIEGQRGEVRPRPPYPVEAGLFGKPTVVDNVETLANVPWIMQHGAQAFSEMGTPESKGTKAVCLNRGFARPGIVEIEFGMPLRRVIDELGSGGAYGVELEAVLLGGPMGSIVTPDQWDAPVCFTAMAKRGINLGHGGLVAIPKPADWSAILRHLLVFMRDESCGKCVPCRLGSARAHELGKDGLTPASIPTFARIMALMKDASLCAFGRETPGPIRTIVEKFGHRIVGEAHS